MADDSYTYSVSVFSSDPRVIMIEEFEGVGYPYLLKDGVRLGIGDEFPEDAVFEVSEDTGDMITDFISNVSRQVIISEKVKAYFIENGLTDEVVEYLPFRLKNKRGRVEKDRFFYIANALLKVDCLDLEKSDYFQNKKKTEVIGVDMVVIDKGKVPDDAIFFRLGEETSRIVFRSDFVEKLKAEGFTGLTLCPEGKELP